MIRRILGWWRARQRSSDMAILWPSCVDLAPDLDHAKAAFAAHAMHDTAWTSLGEETLFRFIDSMTPESTAP